MLTDGAVAAFGPHDWRYPAAAPLRRHELQSRSESTT
jgi:hypothetical protein